MWCRVVAAGITVVASAGNRPLPANWSTPANYEEVITVGGLTDTDGYAGGGGCGPPDCRAVLQQGIDDSFWPYGAYGSPPIDILAPAACLYTTAITESGYGYTSGTSAAAAAVSGAAALYLQADPGATPAQVRAALIANAEYNSLRTPIRNNPMPEVGVVRVIGACGSTDSNFENCGRCGHRCLNGEVCVGGTCERPPCGPPVYTTVGYCDPCIQYPTCLGVNPCGDGGIVYADHYTVCDPNGEGCVQYDDSGYLGGPCTTAGGSMFDVSYTYSVCVDPYYGNCTPETTLCGDCTCGRAACPIGSGDSPLACTDVKLDPLNCGECGNACTPPLQCQDGECRPPPS